VEGTPGGIISEIYFNDKSSLSYFFNNKRCPMHLRCSLWVVYKSLVN